MIGHNNLLKNNFPEYSSNKMKSQVLRQFLRRKEFMKTNQPQKKLNSGKLRKGLTAFDILCRGRKNICKIVVNKRKTQIEMHLEDAILH